MHNVCRLSRRWHQQFCRSPSFAAHQQCLQTLLPVREYRQATRARVIQPAQNARQDVAPTLQREPIPRKNDVVVREYEVDQSDQSKVNRIDPTQEIKEEMADTRMELMNLDRELAAMRQGPFGPQSAFMQSLPKDERDELLQALAKEGIIPDEQQDLLTMAELERLTEEDNGAERSNSSRLGVTIRIPRKDQAYVRHFNQALQAAEEVEGDNVQRNLNLWRWYLRCQQQVNGFSDIVSRDVWQFLWQSQAALKVRPKHIVMLAQDMLEANVDLQPHQWLAYIESSLNNGDVEQAIKTWQAQSSRLSTDPEHSSAFMSVGVRLYASAGQQSKAQELAVNAIDSGKASAEILTPVITAWAPGQGSDAVIKAWACYLRLKQKAGDFIPSETYEQISNAFLDANHSDMALGVFKDMLLMQEASSHDSQQVYKRATKDLTAALRNATTEEHINRIGLSALLVLPKQLQNRFFFTSWVKRLIGEKRVDSAAKVIELMYERGIAPDAKPLNGIIGAWLREGTATSQRKAENMAWSMIESRARFVLRRSTSSDSEGKHFRKVIVDDVERKVPCATIETFSILLQYYTRRQDNKQAEKLTNTMVESCQIQPNSYIMNHWLFGDLRAGRVQVVWDKYNSLKREISPDLETFAALWDTAKIQYSKASAFYSKDFPSARELFAEMNLWATSLKPRKLDTAKEEFSSELYEQVVRCFCLSTDLPGTLLAIHHMARTFGFYPTDNAVRLICGQAARLLPQEEKLQARSLRKRQILARHRSVITHVADIIETIEDKKKMSLVERGTNPDELENPETEIAQQLRLAVLTDFICMFMQKAQAQTGSYRNDIKIAGRTMRVDMEGIDLNLSD